MGTEAEWGKQTGAKESGANAQNLSTSVVKTCAFYLYFADKRKRLVQTSRIKETACNNTQLHSNADGQTQRIAIN